MRDILRGMAIQAMISGILSGLGIITLSAGQQLIAAILIVMTLIIYSIYTSRQVSRQG